MPRRLSSSSVGCPTSIQLRCGSTGPPTHSCSSRSVETGGSRFTITRPVVTSGRLTISPSAPSTSCLQSRTTVRLKFGSTSCGIDRSSDGASDGDEDEDEDTASEPPNLDDNTLANSQNALDL